jgi:hypothetical protein
MFGNVSWGRYTNVRLACVNAVVATEIAFMGDCTVAHVSDDLDIGVVIKPKARMWSDLVVIP